MLLIFLCQSSAPFAEPTLTWRTSLSSVVEAGGRGMLTCARRSLTSAMPAVVFAAGATRTRPSLGRRARRRYG